MIGRIALTGLLAVFTFSGSAMAQSLEKIQGSVLVDRGEGFRPAYAGAVKPGDRIRVAQGGSAVVNYGGGVVVPIRPGQVYAVSEVYGQGTGDGSNENRTAKIIGAGLVGAAAIAIIVCGAADECDDDDNRRAAIDDDDDGGAPMSP